MAERDLELQTTLQIPERPAYGLCGRIIKLKTNHFEIGIPGGNLYKYDVAIEPNTTISVNRLVIQTAQRDGGSVFGQFRPVYDGKTTMYSRELLPQPSASIKVTLPVTRSNGQPQTFEVHISLADRLPLYYFRDAFSYSTHCRKETLDAIEAVFNYAPSLTMKVSFGRTFYSPPLAHTNDLKGGKEVWFGYYQAVKCSGQKTLLNVDVSATSFYTSQPVTQFLCHVLGVDNISKVGKVLKEDDRLKFAKAIKGLKVEVTHITQGRLIHRVCDVTKNPAQLQKFPFTLPNGEIVYYTVARYFVEKYKRLNLSHLPCLKVGKEDGHRYLPIEVCRLVPGQRCTQKLTELQTAKMLKMTSTSAPERQTQISRAVAKLDFNENAIAREFKLGLHPNMLEIEGRVLPTPRLMYKDGMDQVCAVEPINGVWDMKEKRFYLGAEIRFWAVVCFAPDYVTNIKLKEFLRYLQEVGHGAGLRFYPKPQEIFYSKSVFNVEKTLRLVQIKYPNTQIVLVILPGRGQLYAEVKRVGDTILGLPTQCIQFKNVNLPKVQKISNLCLKINAKLGGVNNVLDLSAGLKIFEQPVIIFGAVLSYPLTNDERDISFAAVVSTQGSNPPKYASAVQMQTTGQPHIDNLASMVREQLLKFYLTTWHKPCKIIFYRDGLADKTIYEVVLREITALREACTSLEDDYKPGITYISVRKRHHVRLFCMDNKDKCGQSGNVPPGTVVDQDITQFRAFDFYLCSHQGIQGTSKPGYYYTLWDENKISADELHLLTYHLCHTYVRSTTAVSKPAVVMYAQLAVLRAKHHLFQKGTNGGESAQEERSLEAISNAITVHPNMKNTMYFT